MKLKEIEKLSNTELRIKYYSIYGNMKRQQNLIFDYRARIRILERRHKLMSKKLKLWEKLSKDKKVYSKI